MAFGPPFFFPRPNSIVGRGGVLLMPFVAAGGVLTGSVSVAAAKEAAWARRREFQPSCADMGAKIYIFA